MAEDILQVENVSKIYKLGELNTGSLSTDIQRWIHKMRGKDVSIERLAEVNDRSKKSDSKYVYSLNDVSFSVKRGEVFGIVGKNGAGKSTLLKLLSKITKPTTGSIKIGGRIASLLEVGTGFHPDLSGRENVFLNGSILGMRRNEIKARFDEIVAFSEIERYIDTPVKRYSSGMFVRLAFAVAAHLEQEILILDEVLAVGDAEFQQKCLGKMEDVSKNQGRTVLFVSHNIAAVKRLCTSAMLLEKGRPKLIGSVDSVIEAYQDYGVDVEQGVRSKIPGNSKGYFTNWKLDGQTSNDLHTCYSGENIQFVLEFKNNSYLQKCQIFLRLLYDEGTTLMLIRSHEYSVSDLSLEPGNYNFKFNTSLPVKTGKYDLQMAFVCHGDVIDQWETSTKLKVIHDFETLTQDSNSGILNVKTSFKYESVDTLNLSYS
ncbi:MAG: ATP-binding cassette domain-containing protein [Pyrinomonadaceae bacterium]|nr:ATP-binding cassette domain-containing protein [Sphingobacteriaceae bacterium]